MFKIAEDTELNHISLTGARALVLIGLLSVKPRSFEEIKTNLINLKLFSENGSDDILRIDFSTVKNMGCEITRPSQKTNSKYVLTKHPFSFKLSKEEIEVIKKVYNYVKKEAGLQTLIEYDELFKKIAFYICDEESKESVLGISILKYYDLQTIKDLLSDCSQGRILNLLYKKTIFSKDYEKEIIAKKLVYKNDKIYLYGFDINKKVQTVLNIKRITAILLRKSNEKNYESDFVKIKFVLKNIDRLKFEENEKIIANTEDGFIVEGFYYNDFIAMQRVLSFGKNCTVLEPDKFRAKLIEKIKEMGNIYD